MVDLSGHGSLQCRDCQYGREAGEFRCQFGPGRPMNQVLRDYRVAVKRLHTET